MSASTSNHPNVVLLTIHPMQTRPQTKSMNAPSTNLQYTQVLVHNEPSHIYMAMQSPHWENIVQEKLKALAANNTWF